VASLRVFCGFLKTRLSACRILIKLKTTRNILRRSILVAAFAVAVPLEAAPAPAVSSPLGVCFSPDGKVLAAGDATRSSVDLIDPASGRVSSTVKLAGKPEGLAWSADGTRLFVAESGAGSIAEIDLAKASVSRRFPFGRFPRGLAAAPRRGLLLATDWGGDKLAAIDLTNGSPKEVLETGRQPVCVAVTPDESLAVVGNLLPATPANDPAHAAVVTLVDLETLKPLPPVRLPLGSTNILGVAIGRDGANAFVTHVLGRFHLPTTQLDRGWVNTNAVSVIDLKQRKLLATFLLDQITDGAADPWGIAVDPLGLRLYVALSGVHELAVIDLERLPELIASTGANLPNDLAALHRHRMIRRIALPVRGPRGLAVSPDGKRIAIAGYFSGKVVVTDENAANQAVIPLGPEVEPDLVRRGELAFHDANLCFQRWLSCATCHPDARADGLNWDLLNDGIGNPKNTKSMLLSHATPPAMSLGIRASMEVAARAGFVHIQFTEPKPEDLAAVIAYLRSLEPVVSPHRKPDGSLTESASRGERLFHSPETRCAKCHSGPHFTDLEMNRTGTKGPFDGDVSEFDTPTLVELWRNPPYLHDGSAATLREVLTTKNPKDQHGRTSHLEPAAIDDLVQYLLSL
jgi:DNA-binding beta-propeller fold protein YncE